ncbi:hypothetical protein K439DRAFT_1620457 [Ramaria rubella]|nr:hypothetical protein K439DRAFT_1620457 [Ramaria rubella]
MNTYHWTTGEDTQFQGKERQIANVRNIAGHFSKTPFAANELAGINRPCIHALPLFWHRMFDWLGRQGDPPAQVIPPVFQDLCIPAKSMNIFWPPSEVAQRVKIGTSFRLGGNLLPASKAAFTLRSEPFNLALGNASMAA